jgi:hypothetical protein
MTSLHILLEARSGARCCWRFYEIEVSAVDLHQFAKAVPPSGVDAGRAVYDGGQPIARPPSSIDAASRRRPCRSTIRATEPRTNSIIELWLGPRLRLACVSQTIPTPIRRGAVVVSVDMRVWRRTASQ